MTYVIRERVIVQCLFYETEERRKIYNPGAFDGLIDQFLDVTLYGLLSRPTVDRLTMRRINGHVATITQLGRPNYRHLLLFFSKDNIY